MKEIKLQFHNAKEELPEKSGFYMAITDTNLVTSLDYSAKHKLFNASDNYTKAAVPVKYWAKIDDIEEWLNEGAEDEEN